VWPVDQPLDVAGRPALDVYQAGRDAPVRTFVASVQQQLGVDQPDAAAVVELPWPGPAARPSTTTTIV
jgi:hypothetical protein